MTCLQRPSFHTCLSRLITPSNRLQICCHSSRPLIQVVSKPPRVTLPTDQQHKWSFLTTSRSPTSTPASEHDLNSSSVRLPYGEYLALEHDRLTALRKAMYMTPIEKRIIEILRKTEDYINEQRPTDKKISLYVVGGWVRDKLMGETAPDMDIVLYNISPTEFVQTLIDANGFESHSPRLIPFPPGQHSVEPVMKSQKFTVGTHRFEYDAGDGNGFEVAGIIIFNTLTKIEFTEMKEIPEWHGRVSLEADAFRRELTVNAIYLKLKNYALIDPTGSGVKDLKNKILRTPRKPKITLLDDPTRVIRLMRTASRFHQYGFTIDEDTFAALTDPDVHVPTPPFFPPVPNKN
jgi:Poly A polymerase head domain